MQNKHLCSPPQSHSIVIKKKLNLEIINVFLFPEISVQNADTLRLCGLELKPYFFKAKFVYSFIKLHSCIQCCSCFLKLFSVVCTNNMANLLSGKLTL